MITGYTPLEGKFYDSETIEVGRARITLDTKMKEMILERCVHSSGNNESYAIRLTMPWAKNYIIQNTPTENEELSKKHFRKYCMYLDIGSEIHLDDQLGKATITRSFK